MTTLFYTKNGVVVSITSDEMSIPIDEANRDYRRVMAQDAILQFERIEIPDPEPSPVRNLAAEIDAMKPIIDDLLIGGI